MKIMLLGDYSGLSKNLKEGLLELGHEVVLVTNGDGFKQTVKSDLYICKSDNYIINLFDKIIFPFHRINAYYDYDVVQLIYHNMFGLAQLGYNHYILNKIKNRTGKMFLSACGEDYFVYKMKDRLKYNPWDELIDKKNSINSLVTKNWYIKNNTKVASLVDGIIPSLYTYAEAYRSNANVLNTIPFPMNIKKIKYIPQDIKSNKLKIFHGLNREDFKGTRYIKEAMVKLKNRYPDDVDIVIDGKMPLNKYLKVLEEANIVVDQALSYEYGMNAVYSMAMGKVVLSGNEPECQREFGRTDIPIINITPSIDDIYTKLEKLVLNKKSIEEIGYNSRIFVENFHDYVTVAQKYVDTWKNCE